MDPMEEQDHFENGSEMGYPTACLYFTHLLTFLSFEMCFICMFFKTCMYIWISEIKTNKQKQTDSTEDAGSIFGSV